MIQPTLEQLNAAFNAARGMIDASGYGSFVSDEKCREFSAAIVVAVLNPQPKETTR